ncbi:hypothetical protein ScPMuIL_017003 [Solemya velum]
MNYRLHAFGFMALDILSKDSTTKTSGNYGLMDIIASLKWVKQHIAFFGGNPDEVTIFGQGSGAGNIYALLASRLSNGLFHRAWLSSAAPVITKTTAAASRDNQRFLNSTGCPSVACLRQLNAKQITLAVPWYEVPSWSFQNMLDLPNEMESLAAKVVIDGYVLKEEPMETWLERGRIDVPLLIGSTAQEIDFFPAPRDIRYSTKDYYIEYITSKLSSFDDDVLRTALMLYKTNKSPEYQFTTMVTDVRLTCATDKLATAAALNFRSPVFRYVVTFSPSVPSNGMGYDYSASYAFHGADSLAFFGSLEESMDSFSESDAAFQRNLKTAVLSFVKSGKPQACWKPFPQTTALLNHDITVTYAYHVRQCQFWSENGLLKYGWIN